MSKNRIGIGLATALFIFLLCPPGATGTGTVRLQSAFERWTWERSSGGDETTLKEFTNRLFVAYRLSPRWSVEASTGWTRADWTGFQPDRTEAGADISGLLDTRVRVTRRVGGRWLFRAGFSAPTGTTEFAPEMLPLTQALAARVLEFDGNRLGEGMNLDLGASYAFRAGPAAIGLGAGYLVKGEYSITRDAEKYDPGDQLAFGAGLDLSNVDWLWRSNGRLVFHTTDAFGGADYYRSADRLDLQTTLLRRWPRSSLWGSLCLVRFGRAELLETDGRTLDEYKSNGNEVYADLGAGRTLSERATMSVRLSTRLFGSNDNGQGKGKRFDARGDCRFQLDFQTALELGARISSGTLDDPADIIGNLPDAGLGGLAVTFALVRDF